MEQVSLELKEYIKDKILTQYDQNNVGGHGKEHIETVTNRCFELMEEFNLNLDPDMVYAIASFHDLGYRIEPDNHEDVSSIMFLDDEFMKSFFNDFQRRIIAEAIIDHRASLEYEARSDYGKLVSSADREVSVENMLKRSILFQADKHRAENPTDLQVIDYSYKKLSSKYGKGGYAKMYYPDAKYLAYLDTMQEILEDKSKFVEAELEVMEKLKQENVYSSFEA